MISDKEVVNHCTADDLWVIINGIKLIEYILTTI
jgi:cytochrome b involved in lipid metabolism